MSATGDGRRCDDMFVPQHALETYRAEGLSPFPRLLLIADFDQRRNRPSFQQREVIMKKWQCFCACVCVLALAITVKAQDSESQPATPKLKLSEASSSDGEATPKTSTKLEDLDKRLSKLEKSMAELLSQLIAMQPKLVTKDDFEKMIEQKLKDRVPEPGPVPVTPPGNSVTTPAQSNADPKLDRLEERMSALESNLSDVQLNIAKIGQRLGVKISDTQFDGVKPIVGEITEAVEQKPTVEREAQIIIRNLTREAQILIVDAKEWRIPGDGREYEIPVKLAGTADSVMTQVWPYEKPKIRQFKMVNGRLETRFDITLRLVE